MIDTWHLGGLFLQPPAETLLAFDSKLFEERWTPEVSIDQENFFLSIYGKSASKVGRNHALAFLWDGARYQHSLDGSRSAQIPQSSSEQAKRFRRRALAIGIAHQSILSGYGDLQGQTLGEELCAGGILRSICCGSLNFHVSFGW